MQSALKDESEIIYYKRDLRENFEKLLKISDNTSSDLVFKNIQEYKDDNTITEYDKLVIEFWNDITDEQREYVIKNFDKLDLSAKYSIIDENGNSFQIKSGEESRRAEANTNEIKEFASRLGFNHYIEDNFSSIAVPINIVNKYYDISDIIDDFDNIQAIPASNLISLLLARQDIDGIKNLFGDIDSIITYDEFLNEFFKANPDVFESNIDVKSSSSSDDTYDQLTLNLAEHLKDGCVVLRKRNGYAFKGKIGDWQHGGIFSEDKYNEFKDKQPYQGFEGDVDFVNCIQCIYSAQPDSANDLPDDMRPDRPGYVCLDTLNQYNRGYKCAIITPFGYTPEKGKRAVDYAKSIYYDTKAKYNLPWWEYFFLGDTSHDLSNKNTYCSKVVYTAWKKVGVNLDGDSFLNNLVVPDDIFNATSDHSIGILFWKKTIKATARAKVFDQVDCIFTKEARRIRDLFH